MKIKDGYILREVAGTFVVISTGAEELDFKGVITVNEVGALIWKGIEEGKSKDEIIEKITTEYDVSKETASEDCDAFVKQLAEQNVVEV